MRNSIRFIGLLPLIFLLTGCWDQVELADQAFIVGLGIDMEGDQLSVTYSIPNLPVITGQATEGGESIIKTIEAKTLFEANKAFGAQSEKKLNYDHLQVIVFGEGFMKNGHMLKQVVDQLERNSNIARTILILSTEGLAKDLLGEKIEGESDIGLYFKNLFKNNAYDVLTTTQIQLDDLFNHLTAKDGTVLIPKVVIEEETPKIDGVAVLTDYAFLDWLDDEEVTELSWLMGKGRGTQVKVDLDNGEEVTVEITKEETSMSFKEVDHALKMTVNITCEGDVVAYILEPSMSLFEDEHIKQVEEEVNRWIEKETVDFIKKIQDKYQVDLFNSEEQLAIKDRNLWLKWHEIWDAMIKDATVEVEVASRIRRIGTAK